MDPLALFEARKSIRSFDRALPAREDLETMVNAARLAPTGKNKQNWHIVYTENRDLMEKAARLISEKNERLREGMTDENKKEALKRMAPFTLFFREAPSLVFFFHGEYSVTGHEALRQAGLEEEAADLLEASPGIQGAAAAMENFLLCAAFLGYGTCWMTAPLYAARELESLVGLKRDGFRLMAITPLGKMVSHADSPRPVRKPLVEMLTVIP